MPAGFTMMELMVVVAILTVIIVTAIPNFGTFIANMRLKNASDDLYFTLQQVRMNAIRSGGRWMVVFSNTSYQVINCVDNQCNTTENNLVVKETPFSNYKSISFSDTFLNHTVEFTPDGMVDKPSSISGVEVGAISISNNQGKSKTISISEFGIIRMTSS